MHLSGKDVCFFIDNNKAKIICGLKKRIYNIELDRWGIQSGIPSKKVEIIEGIEANCYSNDSYYTAYNNIIGINNAINWAAGKGYNYIALPKGEYTTCYTSRGENINISKSNITVDFNNSVIKVIFDSCKKNPYDTSVNTNAYDLGGSAIEIANCRNTIFCNCILIGDKIDRDFKVQAEKAVEWSYGIMAGGNSINIKILNCDVSLFMGDGMTCGGGVYDYQQVGYNMGYGQGVISDSGEVESSLEYCTSNYIDTLGYKDFWYTGYGYTQGLTYLTNKNYTVGFYDYNYNYLGKNTDCWILRTFTVPDNCRYIRIQVNESYVDSDGWYSVLKNGYYGQFIYFLKNYIHHNHRGGMSIGVNDLYIQNNYFYRNGQYPDTDNNLPGFEQTNGNPFMTRYHINMEDSQGWDTHIENNKFEDGRLGVAIRGLNSYVENNEFKNCGILLYKLRRALIKGNKCGDFGTFAYNSTDISLRDWSITENEFTDFSISGDSPVTEISNNIINSKFSTDADIIKSLNNNIFKISKDVGYTTAISITDEQINGGSFIKEDIAVKNSITISNSNLTEVELRNEKIGLYGDCILENCVINNCSFSISDMANITYRNCTIITNSDNISNNYATYPYNSALFDVNTGENGGLIILDNCSIIQNNSQPLIGTPNNLLKNLDLEVINGTSITRVNNNKLGIEYIIGTIKLTDSTIESPTSYTIIKSENSIVENMILVNINIS